MDSFDSVDDMWEYLSGLLDYCLDSHVPLKRVSCRYTYLRRHTPWMTPEILCSNVLLRKKIKLSVGQSTQRILMILLGIRSSGIS